MLALLHSPDPFAMAAPLEQIAKLGRQGVGRVAELLFPPACATCGAGLAEGQSARICENCLDQFAEFQPPFCSGCGASVPVPLAVGITCGHCDGRRPRYQSAVALGPYEGLLRERLLKAKKPHGEIVAMALAHRLLELRADEFRQWQPDVVCAVPMHWRRRLKRLANSPSTMAGVLARGLRVPLAASLVRRRRNTRPQFTLPPSSRAANMRGAFRLTPGYRLQAAHVLLVDDILTTGATCNEVARTLLAAGAERVSVAVIARSYSGR